VVEGRMGLLFTLDLCHLFFVSFRTGGGFEDNLCQKYVSFVVIKLDSLR
jgi:hypothetical protein